MLSLDSIWEHCPKTSPYSSSEDRARCSHSPRTEGIDLNPYNRKHLHASIGAAFIIGFALGGIQLSSSSSDNLILISLMTFYPISWFIFKAIDGIYLTKENADQYPSQLDPTSLEDDEVVPYPEVDLSDGDNEDEAKTVMQVKTMCAIARMHLDDLHDEYELSRLKERIGLAVDMADEISDEFYSGTAYSYIIKLAHDAGLGDIAEKLLNNIPDDSLKNQLGLCVLAQTRSDTSS